MPHVQVTIAGRSYRMACGDGEEAHLEALAASFDARVAEMRSAFGEIGDMRLHVMAALAASDELAETKKRVRALETEVAALKALATAQAERADATERQIAELIGRTAERVERLTARLGPSAGQGG